MLLKQENPKLRRASRGSGRLSALIVLIVILATELIYVDSARGSAPPEPRPFWLVASVAGSLDSGGFAVAIGGRAQLTERFQLGLDVEYNPWISWALAHSAPGALNLYGVVTYRWMKVGRIELRSGVYLGVSVLLFNTVTADAGSVGPYAGLNLLSVHIAVSRINLVLSPATLAVPVPQVQGIPLVYYQYRLGAGVELRL